MANKSKIEVGWRPQLWLVLASITLCVAALFGVQAKTITTVERHPVPMIESHRITVAPRSPRSHVGCSQMPCLALTFDDGPNTTVTPKVLAALEQANARATFFVIGLHVPGNEELLRRMQRDGDEVGNHSWAHPDLTKLTSEQIRAQVEQTQAVVIAAGLPAPRLFRPPYGAVNATVRSAVPLTLAMWNVDPTDWMSKDPGEIRTHIESQAAPGRIVDLHDIHEPTAEALPELLTNLQSHFQLVTVSELFNLAPGQRGEYYGR
jgi:peptidoglycan-N-acetylglucosamine deacetylase